MTLTLIKEAPHAASLPTPLLDVDQQSWLTGQDPFGNGGLHVYLLAQSSCGLDRYLAWARMEPGRAGTLSKEGCLFYRASAALVPFPVSRRMPFFQ
jgi:hypothetical protein